MRKEQSGFTMIEVLVTIAILVVGLLGLAAMQTLSTLAELESYQRSQALVLVRDMADRMSANKGEIQKYAALNVGLAPQDCAPYVATPDYKLDLCEWNNQLNLRGETCCRRRLMKKGESPSDGASVLRTSQKADRILARLLENGT